MPGKTKSLKFAVVFLVAFAGCNNVNPGEESSASAVDESGQKHDRHAKSTAVTLLRVPDGGIQPQAVADARGTIHLVYIKGDKPGAADLFYVRRDAGAERFSEPIQINSKPNTACAVGTVRGGQIALGKGGRVHVVWNGVGTDYARMNDAGTAFEEQHNLMRQTYVPDGGGTVAADEAGNVYVAWHGQLKGVQGEEKRQAWIARSIDDGKTFSLEEPVWKEPTGVCPCCSCRAFADHKGTVYFMYRSATAKVDRDLYLLSSDDRGKNFHESLIHKWRVPG
jgi:hypothetical protein